VDLPPERPGVSQRATSLDALIEYSPLAIVLLDPSHHIRLVNPAFERMFLYAAPEVVGADIDDLIAPEGSGTYEEAHQLTRSVLTGQPVHATGRRRRKDGSSVEVEIHGVPLIDNGRQWGVYAIYQDISERREVERLKDEFVAMVSHDLRTPLTAVRLSLGLLADGTLGPQSEKARQVIAVAEQNVARVVNLTNDILDLKRIEAGRLQLKLETLAIQSVVERSVEAVRPLAVEKNLQLESFFSEALVRGDSQRLIQVVVNLLSNAVKFSDPGQAVRVEVSSPLPWVEVRVVDRGRGIPAEHREAIFEPFHQVRRTDASLKGGTGLGLAICRAIVAQHGGSVGVDSQVGRGSTFWFRLPSAGPDLRTESRG
jgi:PAS domain S-box-containing protein